MKIREATEKDFARIWPIFREIVAAGDTYAYARDTTKEQALKIWMKYPGRHLYSRKPEIFWEPTTLRRTSKGPEIMSAIAGIWFRPPRGV